MLYIYLTWVSCCKVLLHVLDYPPHIYVHVRCSVRMSARKDESCRHPTKLRTALALPSMVSFGIESTNGSIARTCLGDTRRPNARWKKTSIQTFRRLIYKFEFIKKTKREAFWHMDVKHAGLCKSVLPCFWAMQRDIPWYTSKIWPKIWYDCTTAPPHFRILEFPLMWFLTGSSVSFFHPQWIQDYPRWSKHLLRESLGYILGDEVASQTFHRASLRFNLPSGKLI